MKRWPGLLLIHLIGCFIFLSLPFIFSQEGPGRATPDFFKNNHALRELVHYVLLLAFFYVNYFYLVPRYYFNEQYPLFGILVLACFLIIAFVPSLIIPDIGGPRGPVPPDAMNPRPGPPPKIGFWSKINHNLFLFFALFFFSLLLRFALRWRQTERQKLSAELSYLKAQVNPHFLFNTLNSIYSLAIEKSDNTATAIVKLSGMMRYITTEASKDYVSLEKEIEYIGDYIDLQSLRFGNDTRVDFSVNGNSTGKKIAPLLLISFIENAFKYGINAEQDSMIVIKIDIAIVELTLKVFNKKVRQSIDPANTTGLGITNTRERLELLYPGKHQLDIRETDLDYSVSLTLQLS